MVVVKKRGISFWTGLFLVFLLALAVRLAYFNVARSGEMGHQDSPAYEELASAIRTGQPYTTSQEGGPGGFPGDLQRPPGYPFFLQLVNPSLGTNRARTALVQSILGAVFAALLAALTGSLISPNVGLLAGFLYAIDWVSVLFTPLVIPELIFTITLTLAILIYGFYFRKQATHLALAAGAVLGVAALIKPAAQVMLGVMVLAWLLQPRRRWVGLAFVIGFAACVIPWMIRNDQRHGLIALSSIDTALVYFYTAQGAASNASWRELSPTIDRLDQEWSQRNLSPKQRREQMQSEAWKLIAEHWPTAIKQALIGFLRSCFGTGRETLSVTVTGAYRPGWLWDTGLPLAQILLLWMLAAVGAVGSYRAGLIPRTMVVLFCASALLVPILSAGPAGYSRYRVPMVPMLCILAALGISQYRKRSVVDVALKQRRVGADPGDAAKNEEPDFDYPKSADYAGRSLKAQR